MYITGYFCVFIKETDNLGFDINNGRGYLNSPPPPSFFKFGLADSVFFPVAVSFTNVTPATGEVLYCTPEEDVSAVRERQR
jgi:hypothetical protein